MLRDNVSICVYDLIHDVWRDKLTSVCNGANCAKMVDHSDLESLSEGYSCKLGRADVFKLVKYS